MGATCHVCGADGGHLKLRCRPHSTEPFFPFLEQQCASRGIKVQEHGIICACQVCHAFLNQQWLTFEKSKTPISKRLYWLKRFEPNGKYASGLLEDVDDNICPDYGISPVPIRRKSRTPSNSQLDPGSAGDDGTQHGSQYTGMDFDVKIPPSVVCYCCGDNIPGNSSCIVHTSHWSKSEAPYFPCILTHAPPEGAKPVDQLGRVLMCEHCTLFLVRQWQTFEGENIPIHERRYHLRPASSSRSHSTGLDLSPQRACLLCLEVPLNKNVRLVHTKMRTPGEPFYPFLISISVPPNVDIYRKDGTAQLCVRCADTLDEQWNAHELAGTPMVKRAYQITKSGNDAETSAVVRYQGSEAKQAKDRKSEVCYLCATQSPLIRIQRVCCGSDRGSEMGGQPRMSFPFIRQLEEPPEARPIRDDHAFACTECFKQLESQWMSFREMNIPLEEQRYVIKGNRPHPMIVDCRKVKKEIQEHTPYTCYLCGRNESCSEPCRLRALPVEEPNTSSSQPFFPFLLEVSPAAGATPLEDDKAALVCSPCEANLLSQWNMYESSTILGKTEPHLRSYLTHSFICTTCRSEVHIRDARAVDPREFPGVADVYKEGNGIVLRGNGHLILCKTCTEIFERSREMASRDGSDSSNDRGEPNSNGRSESVIVIDSDSDGEKDGITGQHRHRNHLYPDSHQETHQGHSGSPIVQRITPEARLNSQGGHHHHHHHPTAGGTKPPPLTIVSSASGRANRTTATVTPFSQSAAANSITVTSGISANALAPTRTSSFAAALRKLAIKQANENDEISPQVSPGSSNRSPSSTPSNKNFHLGPSPLLAPTSTPPVVTIAPTHSVNSRLNSADSRRDLDRYSVWRSKDSPTIQPRSRPMQHIPKQEDNRGFQPYRSGEDLRLPSDIRHPHLAYDPAVLAATMASYQIPPSFIPQTHLPYHAFRPEDQMERYAYLRQPFFPLTPPHLIPHPSLGLIPGLRYPSELAMHMPHLAQGVSYGGLVSSASTAERERVLQDLRERERKMEEAREAEIQHLHRERSNSLSEREERLKDIRRSPPTRDSSHISRMHPHSSRSSSSSSYEHPSASAPMSLVKKNEDDKWNPHKHSHTSPVRSESRHDDRHTSSSHSHKDKQYQRNSHHDSSRPDPDKSHIPRLFQPERRHEREPPKEHSKSRAPPPLVSANVTSHEYSNHRTPEAYHSGDGTAPPAMPKAHSSVSSGSGDGQSFSVKKAKMNNARIPSPLNLQLHAKDKTGNHKAIPVLKPLEMDKPEKEFDYHLNRFYKIQSMRADVHRSQSAPEEEAAAAAPAVSRLDLEALKRQEMRQSGIYITSESESDCEEDIEAKRDRYRRRMHRIATRSRMPLDQSEDKASFLGEIGLVSGLKKQEIVLERIRMRRNLHREVSPFREKAAPNTPPPPPTSLPAAAKIAPKQFKKEPDYGKKCEFLHRCHLKLSSNDRKRELESARHYVETYRTKKRQRLLSGFGDEENKDPAGGTEESLPPSTPLAVQCGTPTIPVHVPGQLYNSTTQLPQQLSSSHKTPAYTLNNHLLQTVPPLQNGMVHPPPTSKGGTNGDTPKEQGGGSDSSHLKPPEAKKSKKSSQFSIASFLDLSNGSKHVDAHSFAQEFHKSVLRKTQKSLASQKNGSTTDNARRETSGGDQHPSSHSRPYSHPPSSASFQWPGVDQLSEAYYRHKSDNELETTILKDQLGRLQSNNVKLRTRDQQLKQRVTDLAERHQSQLRLQESMKTEVQQLQRCFEGMKKRLSDHPT